MMMQPIARPSVHQELTTAQIDRLNDALLELRDAAQYARAVINVAQTGLERYRDYLRKSAAGREWSEDSDWDTFDTMLRIADHHVYAIGDLQRRIDAELGLVG